ncbi:MAG: glycosyltransferase [Bacilli bacterium]
MKKIFWGIQQLSKIGGTELVSINIMNHLVDKYDITIICTSEISKCVYKINPKIKILYLGVPLEVCRYDEYITQNNKEWKPWRNISLTFNLLKTFISKRKRNRREITKIVGPDDLLICSSLDSYCFAPKGVNCYFHFHFNAKNFNGRINQCLMHYARKPDKYIFITKDTLENVVKKHKNLKDKSMYVYNPVRFDPELHLTNHKNTIMFCGRFVTQKDPMLALKIAKQLSKMNVPFKMNFIGSGFLERKMKHYIKRNNLENIVSIGGETLDMHKELLHTDLLLITSVYEGFHLVRGEANSLSVPYISTNWGDACYELNHEGKDGIIIDSRDPKVFALKIKELLNDREKLKNLKKSSYECSLNFAPNKIIDIWKNEIIK